MFVFFVFCYYLSMGCSAVESTSQPPAGYAGELGLVLYFQNEAAASSARVLEPKSEGTGCGERPGYCFDLHPRVLLLLLLCVCEAGGPFPFFSHARPPRASRGTSIFWQKNLRIPKAFR